MKRILVVLCVLALSLQSCDKIEGPYREVVPIDTAGIEVFQRKVLVEDYTGHKCGNCPEAASTAKQIDSIYHGKVVSIAIHAGYFSTPSTSGNYTYDFRTPEGNAIDAFFGISAAGNPNGMVNRKGYPGQHIKAMTDWTSLVQSELALPTEAGIKIANTYNSSTRQLSSSIEVKFLTAQTDSFKLVVYLTEDSIIGYQKDYTLPAGQQDIPNYVHMHALRGSMNGVWGETIASGTISVNQVFTKSYSFTLPTAWKEKNVNVVPVLYRINTYEVLQADEKKAKE